MQNIFMNFLGFVLRILNDLFVIHFLIFLFLCFKWFNVFVFNNNINHLLVMNFVTHKYVFVSPLLPLWVYLEPFSVGFVVQRLFSIKKRFICFFINLLFCFCFYCLPLFELILLFYGYLRVSRVRGVVCENLWTA